MTNKVAIIGYGYVGQAIHKVFPTALVHDPFVEGRTVNPSIDFATRERINAECGLAIVCVPTPSIVGKDQYPEADISIVEAVVSWLDTELILLKSTVPPGTTDALQSRTRKKICFSPEYVGEGGYFVSEWRYMSPRDPRTHEFVIIGGQPTIRDSVANYFVRSLGPEKTYYLIDATEAELVKYMENCWGAIKVVFANEFYRLCTQLGVSYIRVREGWALDNRVERMHTSVFVEAQGFGGKCYPKDLNAIINTASRLGVELDLVKAAVRSNAYIQDSVQNCSDLSGGSSSTSSMCQGHQHISASCDEDIEPLKPSLRS